MMQFLSTWQFWVGVIVGAFGGGIIGLVTAAILAASGQASRMEDELIYKATERERLRRGDYLSSKQMVSDVEDIMGRKSG